ncbi:unnamed protein product [Rhizoctonia solani]|uniref:Uncharacterized protein n=1 Tax=Rhizoctonia solani TaxID=456999 RepID=A0A8H2WD70_9AGAM|nr:unnamed protein product [Rhizoctonia solani]
MRFTNLVLFALSSVSFAFAQTAKTDNDVYGFVSKLFIELQSGPASEVTPKITALTSQLQTLCGDPLPTDPDTRSRIAVQAAGIVKQVANQGMTVGPGGLGGDMQSAIKILLETMEQCVPGVNKDIARVPVGISPLVFMKNNAGDALKVLSDATRGPVNDGHDGLIDLGLGGVVKIEL